MTGITGHKTTGNDGAVRCGVGGGELFLTAWKLACMSFISSGKKSTLNEGCSRSLRLLGAVRQERKKHF